MSEPFLGELRVSTGTPRTPTCTLRHAAPADRAFLLALYGSTRSDELSLTGWPEALQRGFLQMQHDAQNADFLQRHPEARCQVIEVDGHPAGRLWVAHTAESLRVLDISLLPEFRGRGVGARCLRHVLAQAEHAGVAVELQVALGNPARRLCARLGFVPVGAASVHQPMIWHPRATAAAVALHALESLHEQA